MRTSRILATLITLTLGISPAFAQEVQLTTCDNGSGFDLENVRDGHFGRVGIKERSQSMSGGLVLQSQPGKGTSLPVAVPA